MNFLERIQSLPIFRLKSNLFRRDIESAFYTNKEYKLPPFITDAVFNVAQSYMSVVHNAMLPGIKAWQATMPSEAQHLLRGAEKILNGELQVLHKSVNAASVVQITWNKDYFSGYSYPNIPAWKIPVEEGKESAEAAVPFLIGRLQYCTTLAAAFTLSKNPKFADAAVQCLQSFRTSNPIGIGIQWYDNAEVATRAINLFYTIAILYNHLSEDPALLKELLHMLFSHAVFLDSMQVRERFTDHKTLVALLALFLTGTVFSNAEFGKQLLKTTIQQFEQEIRTQVFNDGVAYFHSIPCHCVLVETMQLLKLHCRLSGIELTSHLKQSYHALNNALSHYINEDGNIPQIGDDVFGGILQFEPFKNTPDAIELLNTAFYMNPTNDKVWPPLKPTLSHYIHFSPEFIARFAAQPDIKRNTQSIGLTTGGHFILRSEGTAIFIKAADIGKFGHGAPGHNDSFTFLLNHKQQPFFVDSGTYSLYANTELRNSLRSVTHHNTFYIDLTQLAEFVGTSGIKSDLTKPSVLEWASDNSEDRLVVQHFAYIRLPDPVICKRTFHFNKERKKLKIKDEFIGGANHIIASNLYVHPHVAVEKTGHLQYTLTNGEAVLALQYFIANDYADVALQDAQYSPTYGALMPSKKLHLRYQENLPAFYVMEITLL